jgi:hypothetical protein
LENLKGSICLEDLGIDGKIEEEGGKMWIGFIWLKIGKSNGIL